jgi:hypothetical protein
MQTNHGYSFPDDTDPVGDWPALMQALAEKIESQLKEVRTGTFQKVMAAGVWADHTLDFTTGPAGSGPLSPWKTLPNALAIPGPTGSTVDLRVYLKSRTVNQIVFACFSSTAATRSFTWFAQG